MSFRDGRALTAPMLHSVGAILEEWWSEETDVAVAAEPVVDGATAADGDRRGGDHGGRQRWILRV